MSTRKSFKMATIAGKDLHVFVRRVGQENCAALNALNPLIQTMLLIIVRAAASAKNITRFWLLLSCGGQEMNYLEAIRSGKPYRRRIWDRGVYYVQTQGLMDVEHVKTCDVLAEDWEVKEEPREWWIAELWPYHRDSNGVVRITRDKACVQQNPEGWVRVREVLDSPEAK